MTGRVMQQIKNQIIAQFEHGREMSAAQIADAIQTYPSRVYPSLAVLELEGRIQSRWEHPDSPYPRRRVYMISGQREDANG